MKLLFDQNLSPALAWRLRDVFPGSAHVASLGLDAVPDADVWAFARDHGFLMLTKDADFSELGLLLGFPPKVIWLHLGNCTTTQVENALRTNLPAIERLVADPGLGILRIR